MKNIIANAILLLFSLQGFSQSVKPKVANHTLNQYGIAPLFLGGLFREGLPVSQLKLKGSFGIAAPSLVDGELIEYDGIIYQTKSNGETKPAPDSLKIPFGMFCFFKPDTAIRLNKTIAQPGIEALINTYLRNKNGVYAIKISGQFEHIKSRAFHKVKSEPFPPVANIQAAQQVFDYDQITGTMFGYRMPAHMSGISGTGYHFHFLSDSRKQGGHVLNYISGSVLIEIALMNNILLEIPDGEAFRNYQAKQLK